VSAAVDIKTAPVVDLTGGQESEAVPFTAQALADALAAVEARLRRFVVVGDAELAALALWAAHTHCYEQFDTTPYIHVSSPEKECGKTRIPEVLWDVVNTAMSATAVTGPTLFRRIDEVGPTVIIDEADQLFGGRADSEKVTDITTVLNIGYRGGKGSTISRLVPVGKGLENREFNVFCPKMILGIRDIPEALESRCVPIRMRRKLAHQEVERLRLGKERAGGEALGEQLAAAVQGMPVVEIPDDQLLTLTDRQADCWEPLLVLAKAAGGEWYDRALAAAEAIHRTATVVHQHPRERILADVREVWPSGKATITSEELLDGLAGIEDGPWADWFGKRVTIQSVSAFLKPYGLKVGRIGRNGRGWSRSDFEPLWDRYCGVAEVVTAAALEEVF
jgi:uncharacterized protein DUF3631